MAYVNARDLLVPTVEDREICKRHAAWMRRLGEKNWRWQDSLMAALRAGLAEIAGAVDDAPEGE